MIDTHCHLTDPRLLQQLEAVLQRALAAGVSRMVTIGTEPSDWDQAIAVCQGRPYLRCAIGAHPNYCQKIGAAELARLRHLQENPSVVALGEMGLDYHYDFAPRQRQTEFLQNQLQLAAELARPVVIHCRDATDDCLAILRQFPSIQAVFHCFTGTAAEAGKILDAGYLLGFTGIATYKNAPELREIAAVAPADRILLETDAPYLTPEPMRKLKINEPAMVVHTAAALAAVRKIAAAEIDAMTTKNALRFYGGAGDWPAGLTPAC